MAAKTVAKKAAVSGKVVKSKARVVKPPLDFEPLAARGEAALKLVEEAPLVLERLESGTIPGLEADLDIILGKQHEVILATTKLRATTQEQNKGLVVLYKSVSAIRTGIQKSVKDRDLRTFYGLGKPMRVDSLVSVTAAAKTILDRANEHREEARSIGILDRDLANLEVLVNDVVTSDKSQKKLAAAKPITTRERNEAGQRAWKAIGSISAKGVMAYALDEPIRARFDLLDDLPKKPVKK